MRVLLVVLLFSLASVTPAFATTVVTPDAGTAQPYQSWADQSLVPTPAGTVVVHLEPCPNAPAWAAGCAVPEQRTIYLGPTARTKDRFLHELGHIFDATTMTDPLREAFEDIIRFRGTAWIASASTNPPNEQFAEAFSLCARHRTVHGMWGGMYGYSPTATPHRQACTVIREAANINSQ
jgi:hypothetical protein